MKQGEHDLLLFTTTFPYGYGETFLENELAYLSERFRKVFIFPNRIREGRRSLPSNVEVVVLREGSYSPFCSYELLFLFIEQFFFRWDLRTPRYQFSVLKAAAKTADEFLDWYERQELQNPIFYTYWFAAWANVLALLKRKKIIEHFISRGHSGELYKDRARQLPLWSLRAREVDRLFTISEFAKNYLIKERGLPSERIEVARLGVEDRGENPIPKEDDPNFRLLSCSTMVGEKRLELLMDALKELPFELEWWHIGSGKYKQKLLEKRKELPDHVSVSFLGQMKNQEVLNVYREHPIDLFINVSSTEGIPVAIMEAISFGIPVIGTDVGGMREIVTQETGKLLPSNPSSSTIAKSIYLFRDKGWTKDQMFRRNVKGFFRDRYFAEQNYLAFVQKIEKFEN